MLQRRLGTALLLSSVLMACSTEKPVAKPDAHRALALAPPAGATTIDQKIIELQASAQKNPNRADSWVLLGRAWIQKARQSADPGFYLHSDACADIALDIRPQYSPALDLKALAMINDHRFAEAAKLANTILASDPDDLMALGVLSDAELEMGNLSAAAEAAQKMIDLKPNLPSYSRAAYLRWLTGDIKAAKSFIRLAMDAGLDQRDPEPGAWVLVEAAKIFFGEGDYEGADAGFDRALARFPNYPPALLGKAKVMLALGRFDRAAELAKKSFEASPLAETAWVWGDAERAAGRAAAAEQAFAKVIELGRKGDARTLAAFLATENRDLQEALKAIEADLAHRGGPFGEDAHAWTLYRLGRFAEARAASDRALKHGTRDATLLYHAGAIRIAAGEVEAGLKLVREALALNPKFQLTAVREATQLLGKFQSS